MTATEHDLPRCPILDALAPSERRDLVARLDAKTFPPGTVILEEGKRTRALWVLNRGRCRVVKANGGADRSLAELAPGAVFGEMSFLHPAPHSATVRAETEVSTLRLPYERYAELEREAPAAARAIAQAITTVLSERLRRMDDWTSRLLSEAPPEKHAEWAEFRAKLYNHWEF